MLYPDGKFPPETTLDEQRQALYDVRSKLYDEYRRLKKEYVDLDRTGRIIEQYPASQRDEPLRNRKKSESEWQNRRNFMARTTNMAELNEKFSDCSTEADEYEINGVKYRVISHFTGTKDVDEVIFKPAFEKAVDKTLKKNKEY